MDQEYKKFNIPKHFLKNLTYFQTQAVNASPTRGGVAEASGRVYGCQVNQVSFIIWNRYQVIGLLT